MLAQAQTLAPKRLEMPLVLAQRALVEGDYVAAATQAERDSESKKILRAVSRCIYRV